MELKFQLLKYLALLSGHDSLSPAVDDKYTIDFSEKDSATDAQWSCCLTSPMLR